MDINYTDMLSRKLDNFIEKHYENNKSALLLKGARQVGKTSAIFTHTYQNCNPLLVNDVATNGKLSYDIRCPLSELSSSHELTR